VDIEKTNKIIFALILIVVGVLSIYDITNLPYALIGYGIGRLFNSL
jgi:hypothetical protein